MGTQVEYDPVYVLRVYGQVTGGKKAGTVLTGEEMEMVFLHTKEEVKEYVERYRGIFTGRVEILTKTYRSRPRRHFVYQSVAEVTF